MAAAITVGYLFLAFYILGKLNNALLFWLQGAYTGFLISLIVFASIYFYNVYRFLGYETKIAENLRGQKEIQLSLATFFAGFIECVSGFGIPPAVVAPLIYSTGTPAVLAVCGVMIGHTWAVPFASMGVPTAVLARLSEVDTFILSSTTGIYMSFSLAIIVIVVSRILSMPFTAAILYSLLSFLIYPIAVLLGPLTGSVTGIILFAISLFKTFGIRKSLNILSKLKPYLLLTTILMTSSLFGLRGLKVSAFLIALTGIFVQFSSRNKSIVPFRNAIKIAWKPSLAIILFASAAEMAGKGGFMYSLARMVSLILGKYYLFAVPVVGAVGAYFTGSNTTSNIVFAKLQESYANLIGYDEISLLALQNTGGGIGSMTSPSKIAVGSSTIGENNIESEVLRKVIKMLPVVILPQILTVIVLGVL